MILGLLVIIMVIPDPRMSNENKKGINQD